MKINQLLETPIDMTGDPNDPVVYGHEKANPMSLKGRIVQARNQLKELAQLAESDDLIAWEKITRLAKGGMFMGLEQNLEQIRHGIEQLAAKRKQGGVASRGIDKNIGEQDVAENKAAGIAMAFNNLGDPVYSNLQRVALLAMQGRQAEAAGRLQTVIKDADPAVQKKIIDAVNNIKPVTINGKIADSSTLDKSTQHNDWITNTFIPWVQSLTGTK